MAKAANSSSTLNESTKSSHVTYRERYESGTNSTTGAPTYSTVTWHSDAVITGVIDNPSSNVLINGSPAVTVGDSISEQWEASPEPYEHYGGSIISITPGTSGSGSGSVSVGSGNVLVNGKPLAYDGSTVTTHLGNSTTINGGSSNVIVN
jgi:uncharacterized Zn-binding protein involved in type VI secretion